MKNENDVYVDDVLDKIKHWIKRIVRLIIRFFSLVWAKKIIILGLLIIGVIIGFILDMNKSKRFATVLQLRTLQSSTEYVYSLIDNLNKNLGDTLYLQNNGLQANAIKSLEIMPMANMQDLLYNLKGDDSKTLETLILNTSTQDLLTSEFFRSQYNLHQVTITSGSGFGPETIDNLITFLNNSDYYQELYVLEQESYNNRIEQGKKTLDQIDTLITNYNNNLSSGTNMAVSTVSEQRAASAFDLLNFKNNLVEEIEELKESKDKLDAPVTLTNKPIMLEVKGISNQNILLIPLLLVCAFLIVLLVVKGSKRLIAWSQRP